VSSKVEATIEIDAPPQEVWDLVMDPHRLGDWVSIHKELVSADEGAPSRGMEMQQKMVIRGASFKVSWTLAECRVQERAVWEGKGPAGSKARTAYELTPLDGGKRTRFDYENEFFTPGGALGKIASRAVVGDVPEREAHQTLANLKKLLEGG
jgi:carbon monoxide dehydrogenase subunit G